MSLFRRRQAVEGGLDALLKVLDDGGNPSLDDLRAPLLVVVPGKIEAP
jgi:hypothetical protein